MEDVFVAEGNGLWNDIKSFLQMVTERKNRASGTALMTCFTWRTFCWRDALKSWFLISSLKVVQKPWCWRRREERSHSAVGNPKVMDLSLFSQVHLKCEIYLSSTFFFLFRREFCGVYVVAKNANPFSVRNTHRYFCAFRLGGKSRDQGAIITRPEVMRSFVNRLLTDHWNSW